VQNIGILIPLLGKVLPQFNIIILMGDLSPASCSMNGENWLLVRDEPVEFEK